MVPAIRELDAKQQALAAPLLLRWTYPPRVPASPLDAKPRASWKTLERGDQEAWVKNGPNWFYALVEFPERCCGVPLDGEEAVCFVHGWQPFTLWVDGEEIWKEAHPWKATGPIADPFPVPMDPARPCRMVACVVPTELPGKAISLTVNIVPRRCLELAEEVEAASAQLTMARELARSPAEQQLVDRAARAVDLGALERNDWPAVLVSLAAMEQRLLPLSSRAKAMTVHLIGHAHIDMDWMWTWPDTVNCIRRDFKAVTNLMDDDPEVTFTHSQVPTYDVARRMDPDVFRKVKARMAEGRWENAAGTWVEGDLNMADGESVARHMLYAKQWTRRHLGTEAKVLWEPDTFGHPGNMPQMARLGEFDGYFHMRCHPDKGIQDGQDPVPVRMWAGVDGTKIPSFSMSYNGGLGPSAVVGRMIQGSRLGLQHAFHVWGLGDHGGALSRRQVATLSRYRGKPLVPSVRFSTMRELLAAVTSSGVRLPGNKGETYSLFEGCFTTHASIKGYNRQCEGALLEAESLACMAGMDRTAALRGAWIPTLFNHFHDIMDGASVHDAYRNAHKRARKSLRAARRVVVEACDALVAPVPKHPTALTLINPLGFERTEPVRVRLPPGTECLIDESGTPAAIQKLGREHVFIAAGVPAFSSRTWCICRRKPKGFRPDCVQVREEPHYRFFRVETPGACIRISRDSGAIGSYVDRDLDQELVSYGVPIPLTHVAITHAEMALNVFQLIDESPNTMSAWLIHDVLKQENLMRGAKVSLVDAGPVFARFRVAHAFRSSRITEDILIYRDFSRVDFEVDIDWREQGNAEAGVPQLKVSFATCMRAARAHTEGPFVVREIAADGMEMPTQKWADLSGDEHGFTVFNDCKYGIDALGGRLRLTLLRNPYSPDPETDNGRHKIRFAFQPHGSRVSHGELVRRGMAYNRPMADRLTREAAGTRAPGVSVHGAEDVVCTALRRAEYSDATLVRLFNAGAKACTARVRAAPQVKRVTAVNFLENPLDEKLRLRHGEVALNFRAFEVKTLSLTGA